MKFYVCKTIIRNKKEHGCQIVLVSSAYDFFWKFFQKSGCFLTIGNKIMTTCKREYCASYSASYRNEHSIVCTSQPLK